MMKRAIATALGLIILLLSPYFVGGYVQHILILVLLYTLLGSGWNVIGGYTGQFSLGHAAFFGVAAYLYSIMVLKEGLSPLPAAAVAVVAVVLLGCFIGYLSFRYGIKGPYFTIITLCYAEILRLLFLNWDLSGGAAGLLIFGPNVGATTRQVSFYLILGMVVLGLLVTRLMERSKIGDYFRAIREDEDAAESVGIDTMRYKVLAIAVSCVFMAAGGIFYSQYMLYLHPDLVMGVGLSIDILFVVLIGGAGSLYGPVVGSFIIIVLKEATRFGLGQYSEAALIIYGVVIVLAMRYMPGGVVNQLKKIIGRIGVKNVKGEPNKNVASM